MEELKTNERDFVLAISMYGLFGDEKPIRDRFSLDSLDWAYVLGQLLIHRLAPLSYTALADEESLSTLPRAVAQWLRRLHFQNKIQQQLLSATAAELTVELKKVNIPHCYLKGAVLQADYYPLWSRQYNDLDILVDPRHLSRVSELLQSIQFTQGWLRGDIVVPPTRQEMVSARINSHELVPFCRRTHSDAVPYVNVDLQFELPGTKPFDLSVNIGELLRLRRSGTKTGLETPNLPPQFHLVVLCCHQQMHAAVADEIRNANDLILIRLSDVARVAAAVKAAKLWDEFVLAAKEMGALELVGRCLTTVATIYGERVASLVTPDSRDHPTLFVQRESAEYRVGRAALRERIFDIGGRGG